MKKLAIVLWGLMLFAVQPVAGQFVPEVLPDAPQDNDQVQFIDINRIDGSGVVGFGAYLGPYDGMVGGTPASIYCVDYGHHVGYGDVWSAFSTALDGSENMSDTRLVSLNGYDGVGASVRYRNAAFLASLFSVVDDTPQNWTALHGMIWTLTSPEFVATYGESTMESYFGTGAAGDSQMFAAYYDDWQTFNPTGWYVLTDVRSSIDGATGIKQEFLVQSTVPEPETYVLLLSGLVMIFFVARRRMKENGYI